MPGSQLPVRVARLLPRLVRQHQDERVQPVIVRLDPLETLVGERFRRERARPQTQADVRNRIARPDHGFLTEIATPSLSGTMVVVTRGCALSRWL